jgi:hypothetical protein
VIVCNEIFVCINLEQVRKCVGSAMASYMEQIYQTYDWKVPRHITEKPSKLPAIEKPLAGTSYNPTFDDHQVNKYSVLFVTCSLIDRYVKNLLRKAVDVELAKERRELKLQRNLPTLLTQNVSGPIKVSRNRNGTRRVSVACQFVASLVQGNVVGSIRR